MNEQLKKIMLESGTHKYISSECQHRIEIVAELIVLKCAEIADTAEPFLASDLIKQHFGVEE